MGGPRCTWQGRLHSSCRVRRWSRHGQPYAACVTVRCERVLRAARATAIAAELRRRSWRVPDWDVVHRCLVGFAQGSDHVGRPSVAASLTSGPPALRWKWSPIRPVATAWKEGVSAAVCPVLPWRAGRPGVALGCSRTPHCSFSGAPRIAVRRAMTENREPRCIADLGKEMIHEALLCTWCLLAFSAYRFA
jgi:hypothetical protein